jgi:hypothetical protein
VKPAIGLLVKMHPDPQRSQLFSQPVFHLSKLGFQKSR